MNKAARRTKTDLQQRIVKQTEYKRVLIRRAGIFLEQQEQRKRASEGFALAADDDDDERDM